MQIIRAQHQTLRDRFSIARSNLVKLGIVLLMVLAFMGTPLVPAFAADDAAVGWWPRVTAQIEKVWSIAYGTASKIFSGEALQAAQLGSSNNELVSPTSPTPSRGGYVPTATSQSGTLVINAPLFIDTNLRISGLSTFATTTILGLLTIDALETNTLTALGAATFGSASVLGPLTVSGGLTTNGSDIDLEGGNLFASNVVNELTAGDNIVISGTQNNPIVSVDIEDLDVVRSLNGDTGDLDLEEGDDIEINGLTIENVSTLDTVRDRGGCAECILDSDVEDTLTIYTGSIDDTIIGASAAASAYFTDTTVGATSTAATLTVYGTFTKVGTATSTFGGGINITNGCYAINGVCVVGATPSSYVGLSDTPDTLVAGALQFANATSSALTQSANLVFLNDRLGIGTSTPTDTLTVVGDSVFTGGFEVINSTSSQFVGGINVTGGCVSVNGTCLGGADRLADLTDVSFGSTTAGDLLQYDGSDWVNVSSAALGYGDGTYLGLDDTPDTFVAGALQFANATSSALTQSASLTFSNGSLRLGTSTVATRLSIDGDASLVGQSTLRFYTNGANYVGFRASTTLASDTVWTLPAEDGTSNQILVTDGSGNLRFADVSAIGGGSADYLGLTDTPNAFVAGAIQYVHASGTYLTQNSNFVFTGTNLGIGVAAPTEMLEINGSVNFNGTGGTAGFYYNQPSGYVGIGTESPFDKLTIFGGSITQQGPDSTNDYNPSVVAGVSLADTVFDIAVSGNFAYLVSSSAGNDFHVIEVTNPTSPAQVASINLTGSGQAIVVRGKYAFVGSDAVTNNFHIIDISNPLSPVQVAAVTAPSGVNDIAIAGRYAYVATDSPGDDMTIYDILDPLRPVQLGGVNLPTNTNGLAVQGNYVFAVTQGTGDDFHVIDVSNPSAPTTTDTLPLSDGGYEIAINGNYAYVSTNSTGNDLHVINITNKTAVTETSSVALDAAGRGVAVAGRYVYVATMTTGDDIEIVDVSNPAAAVRIGGSNLGAGDAYGIRIVGRYAYMTTSSGGNDFHVVDISGATLQSAIIYSIAGNQLSITDDAAVAGRVRAGLGVTAGAEGFITDGSLIAYGSATSYIGGSLGIGTTSTSSKLTVAGSIKSTSLLGGATNLTTDANGVIIRDPSDARLKENVREVENALELLTELRGVRYEWVDKERFGPQVEIGFIAQEVDLVLPEVVSKGGEYWSLNKSNMIALVVEAVKELWETVRGQGDRINELETRVLELEAQLNGAGGQPAEPVEVEEEVGNGESEESVAPEDVNTEALPEEEGTDPLPTIVPSESLEESELIPSPDAQVAPENNADDDTAEEAAVSTEEITVIENE